MNSKETGKGDWMGLQWVFEREYWKGMMKEHLKEIRWDSGLGN